MRKHRGAAPEPVGSPPLTLTITFSAGSAGLAAMVYVSGRRAGVRRLADPGPDCAALADAVVVTLAMTLDEFLAAPVPEPGMAEPRAAEKHPQVTYAALPSQFAAGSPPRRDRPSFWVGPGVALTSGLPQGVSWMLTARAGLDVRRISVALGGFWSSRRRVEFTPQPIEVKLAGGSIELCYAVVGNPTAWRADICPLVGLGALTGDARATTYSGRTAETQPWFAPGARAELRGPVAGPLQLALGATFLVPITPNRFYVENATPEFKSKPGIRMGAELIVKLW